MSEVMSQELAEEEFERFKEVNKLGNKLIVKDQNDRRDADEDRLWFVRALMEGSLTVDEAGKPTYTPVMSENQSPLTFNRPKGRTLAVTDKMKESQKIGQMHAMLQQMTGAPTMRFVNMEYTPDYLTCMAIATIFLAS